MKAVNDVDVLVVGSGGSGLVAAANLALAGVSCRIIEKNADPFPGSRGKGLIPRALELLDNLGVLEAISAHADWVEESPLVAFFASGELVGTMKAAGPHTPDRPYLANVMVPQWHTEGVLRDLLAEHGVKVEWSTELVDFAQDDEGVTASVRCPNGKIQSIRVAFLVGGDGARSTVRKKLGIKYIGGAVPDANCLVGDVEISGLEYPEPTTGANQYCWISDKGGAVFVRRFLVGEKWQFQAQIDRDENGNLPPATIETMQKLINERSGRTDISVHDPSSWVSHYLIRVAYAERFQSGRVFIAGEAAHVQTGGGLCSGIYDSSNLSWKLVTVLRGGPVWLLDTYDSERRQSAQREIQIMHERMFNATNLNYKSEGRAAPDAKRMVEAFNDPRMSSESFTINHRESPLSVSWGVTEGKSVLAGDRAPDSPCVNPVSGETVRLFDLYRGPHWTLLGYGLQGAEALRNVQPPDYVDVNIYSVFKPGEGEGVADENAVLDAEGYAYHAFEVDDSAIILIRPDNVIGLIARPADSAALDAYFDLIRKGPLV